MIQFLCDNVPMPAIDIPLTERWVKAVAAQYGFSVGELNYIFCDDAKILQVNREFLKHDYYTDIITFDYSARTRVNGISSYPLTLFKPMLSKFKRHSSANSIASSSTDYYISQGKPIRHQKPKRK